MVYHLDMLATLTAVLFSITLHFGIQSEGGSIDSQTITQESIDLTMTINDQVYPCKVIINKAAERGGAAILFLHGYGECGTDGEKQLTVGLPKHAKDNPEAWPFVLIVPQKPIFNTEWEDHEEALLKLLAKAREQGLYDPDRLAITGLSQGGHGTIYFASHHPELFTAAAPVCGYVERRISKEQTRVSVKGSQQNDPAVVDAAKSLAKLPVWLFHGEIDSVVPVSESQSLYAALQKLDADVKYTEVPDTDHNSWDFAYQESELSVWLFDHTRKVDAHP